MLFLIYLLIFKICLCFDPDIDICEDPVPDSAVVLTTNYCLPTTNCYWPFAFKGKYFWFLATYMENKDYRKGKSYTKNENPTRYGGLITDRWPHLTDKIRASFTIYRLNPNKTFSENFYTVYIVRDKWFVYYMDYKTIFYETINYPVMNGSTNDWPHFSQLDFEVMFTVTKDNTSKVLVIHNKHRNYSLYDFKDFFQTKRPEFIENKETDIRFDLWTFMNVADTQSDSIQVTKSIDGPDRIVKIGTLNHLFDLKAVLTFNKSIIMISDKMSQFCVIKKYLRHSYFFGEKRCDMRPEYRTSHLFECPFNLTIRPSYFPRCPHCKTTESTTVTNSTSNQILSTKPLNSSAEHIVNPNDDSIVISKKTFIFIIISIIIITLQLCAIIFITYNYYSAKMALK